MDAVEEIKGRLGIEDVISQYVELKRAGRNLRGLSPFGNEKTPSFMVSPEKQIWHDFSSGKGGNMFSFVMEMEGLDFKGALELLARQAGVDLSQYRSAQSGEQGKQKERVMQALEAATHFYQVQFSKNKTALEYILKTRKFSKDTALAFRIGYSPNSGTALVTFLKGKGFSEQEIKQAGLSSQRYRGAADMFRGRIMIPLMDQFGKVIGFTARLLEDEPGAPKYVNTPQTLVYDKSRHVFGLHLAKEAIRTKGYSVVVEGNLDVIASYQAGVRQVAATAGTAMTEQHLKALGRFAPDVRLAFDQDGAGIAATERAIPIANRAGVSLSIIDITGAKDPDELIQQDPKAWEQAVTKHKYAVDWLIERYQERLDLTSGPGKREFTDVVLKVVKALQDSVEQDHYIIRIAELIGVSPDALRTKIAQGKPERAKVLKKQTPGAAPKNVKNRTELIKIQNHLLALTLMQRGFRNYLKILDPEMLLEPQAQEMLAFLQENPEYEVREEGTEMQGLADYVKILVLLYEELYQDLELLELRYEAARLQVRLIEQYVKTKKAVLAQAMRAADEKQIEELLEEAKAYDNLLNAHK
jgi:DNA primase